MVEEKLLDELLSNRRNFIKLGIDISSVVFGVILALLIRFEGQWLEHMKKEYIVIYGSFFMLFYLFKRDGIKSWSFTNSYDVLNLLTTNLLAFFSTIGYMSVTGLSYSRTIVCLIGVLTLIIQLCGRFIFRLNRTHSYSKKIEMKERKKVIIYGAGEMGVNLAREKKINKDFQYEILGFIDDDNKKRGTYVNGVKVLGNLEELEEIVERKNPKALIIAILDMDKKKLKNIMDRSKELKIELKIFPHVEELLSNGKLSNQVRDVSIEDLLGREQILVNGENIKNLIENKVVFVTGGAGSIGSELARQIVRYNPKKLVTIDINENDLYFLELDLKRKYKNLNLQSEICNIRERDKLNILFEQYKPQLVFHAAAHKHVPLMEHNPEEAIKNNIFGTKNMVDISNHHGVERFVLISTDKAVNPTNIMGATKRACELIVENMNKQSETKFMAVRFGNVLGSNGSVIPIFRKLINEGKNLTLTHPDITRYFMTIPEAAQLVIEAGALGKGGELFILDMGEPVRIMDLARTMIELSNSPVEIDIVGLRPGEKLYEELLYDVTKASKTENNKIFITEIDQMDVETERHIEKLKLAIKNPHREELKKLMRDFVTTYGEGNYEKINQSIGA